MKKQQIREAVAAHLADLGYSPGWYRWHKPGQLLVWSGKGDQFALLRLPAGKTSKRSLAAELSALPRVGSAIVVPAFMKDDGRGVQLDWVDAR